MTDPYGGREDSELWDRHEETMQGFSDIDHDDTPVEITGPGIYPNIPMAAYLGDPLPEPSLSSSIAHTLAVQSPRHAYQRHPKLGGGSSDTSDEQSMGTLYHDLLLEDGKSGRICVVDAKDFRTKQAQLERDAALASGLVPIIKHKYLEALDIVEHMKAAIHECGYWSPLEMAVKESTLVWRTEGGLLCRCRPDGLLRDPADTLIIDLKTCRSAAPDDCAKAFVNYGYDIASVVYPEAVETLWPECAGRVRMVFLFCEIEAPYVCTPVIASGEMLELGARKWRRARERWAHGLETGDWPGYSTTPVAVVPPQWELQKEGM